MVRILRRLGYAGLQRAAFSLALVFLQADFSACQAQQAALNAPPPSTAPSGDLPEGPGATIVGALEEGVGSQGSVVSGNTVLSSPNLTATPLNQTASSVTVITAEQIQQRGQVNAAEVLRGVPGLDVVRNSTPGSPTSVFLRGAPNEHTKVLIDGIGHLGGGTFGQDRGRQHQSEAGGEMKHDSPREIRICGVGT